ncbi:MAG: hypothetical protein CVU96_05975 [Firmicutes bacterium HGW-Firmicutes-20]|nr:MAG: hypothetical protein CVU96_05975 [Firmicutes bacterium HGW-Firmicutes-20]PKM69336.1 MAG: hypothetical protein CVU94_04210 [Firmicutes bacterium HGW-Firmicutes-19]
MKWISKHVIILLVCTMAGAALLTAWLSSINQITDVSSFLTIPMIGWIEWLRNLSLSSQIGNMSAWLLLLLTSSLPVFLLLIQRFRTKSMKLTLVMFSIFMAISQYILINPWLLFNNEKIYIPEFQSILILIFTLVILSMALTIALFAVIRQDDSETVLITRFQWFLWIALIGYASIFTMTLVSQWQQYMSNQGSWIQVVNLLIVGLPSVLLLFVTATVIQLLQQLKVGMFNPSNLLLLKKLKQLTSITLSLSVISIFLYNLLQLISFRLTDSIHFSIHFPALELSILFVVLFISTILEKSIPVHQENQTFV